MELFGPQFVLLVILAAFSAFFSASETSMTSINKIRMRAMSAAGIKNASLTERLTKNIQTLLSTVLIGNNVVNLAISSITTSIVIKKYGNSTTSVVIATVVATVGILLLCEVTPKTLAANKPERFAFALAQPVRFMMLLFTPFTFALSFFIKLISSIFGIKTAEPQKLTETEIKTMVDVGHEDGVLEIDEHTMINNVFDFGDSCAKDVMTPRTDIVSVELNSTYNEVYTLFRQERFTRLPVCREDNDHIVGILHFKDFVFSDLPKKSFKIEALMREPFFTYETIKTSQLFAQMRSSNLPIAIVLDEHGGTAGLVAIEDLVEEIVGEIFDEYDETEEEIEIVEENEYIVDGSTHINDFNEMANAGFASEDYDTIGGYAMGVIGEIPAEGTIFESAGFIFTIEEVDKNRIEKLRIRLRRETENEA